MMNTQENEVTLETQQESERILMLAGILTLDEYAAYINWMDRGGDRGIVN
jgi:hypothetical protein